MYLFLSLGTSDGWFVYIETSVPAKQNDTARLLSLPVSGSPAVSCLSFYYHMRGVHIDTLNVLSKLETSGNESIIWSKTGNQGNKWFNGKVNLDSPDLFKVIFEARRGTGYNVRFLNKSKKGLTGDRTRSLSHPKRESYH